MSHRVPILCADGTIISVQASSTNYCSPRSAAAFAYGMVEIMIDIPNDPEHYNKVDKNEGWVNGERVLALIAEHGGVIGGQLPPLDFGNHHLVKDAQHKITTEGEAWWQARQAEKEEEGVDESE